MKKILLAIVLILFVNSLWSQSTNQDDSYTITLNGNTIVTKNDFDQKVKLFKKLTSKQSQKDTYTLLQFGTNPTIKEQQKLKEQGVTLISYLSNNAYYALIKSNFYNKSTFSKNIRTTITVAPEYKLDPIISKGVIPDYALDGDGIKVVVSYFKGANATTITNDLNNLNVEESKKFDAFNEIYVTALKNQLLEIAKLNWVQNIELVSPPVESDNKPGVSSHKANILNSNITGLGYNLTGKGVKIGIWDGNVEKHKDHSGRLVIKEYEVNDSHGSHVSGIAAGAGLIDPKAKGMAPEVNLYAWNYNTQSNGLPVYVERVNSAADDGIEITQNSYGVRLTSGFNTLGYSASDRGDDEATVQFPYLLNIYSNGNYQKAYPGGFNTSTKNSKNALHVAANNADELISDYSSFGPTIDGRLVPQIAAIGTGVYSLDYNNAYQILDGTSMATPGVSGTMALLYERYKNIYGGQKPLASLMKALVCNTAKDVGNKGPDYKYGFGNLNGLRAVKALDNVLFYTGSVSKGETYEKNITVPAGLTTLKVMLSYSDVAATPGAGKILVNDLDIKIIKNGLTVLPWILNPAQPNALATRGIDDLNNIEQITIDNPESGTYKIVVTGTNIPLGSQEFSIVYDYVAPEILLTYPVGGEKMNPATTEYIRWEYEGTPTAFTVEYSIDGGINYKLISKNISSAVRSFLWTVPSEITANAKIRVSAGTKIDTSKEVFTIMTVPKNLAIGTVASCGADSFLMNWSLVSGAKYEVLKLNGAQYDVVATVTNPNYTFTGITSGENNWFSVRAIDIASNATSERVKAVNFEPVTSPTLTQLSLPFLENFNEKKAVNFTLTKSGANGTIGYEFLDKDLREVIKMAGIAYPPTTWVASTTETAFTNNPTYKKILSFCNIDATTLTGKNIRLKFNLIWSGVTANRNFFRVLVNGIPINSTETTSVYGGTTLTGNKTLTYDLVAYAGTSFDLSFEAINTNATDIFRIDNVEIFEAKTTDLALSSLTTNTGLTSSETVSVKVANYSLEAVSNIPVSYRINSGTDVTEIVPGPIAPLGEVSYDFTQKADYSVPGIYTIEAKVNFNGDEVPSNNSITKTVTNVVPDIVMGSTSLVTTCSAVFTDSGTRNGNYANKLTQIITFAPAIPSNKIKVDFTEFSLENNLDLLYIYNGTTTASPLLGVYTGNSLPLSLSSTANGGELTFRFTSSSYGVDLGWIATISCTTTPTTNDATIVSIGAPEVFGKKTNTNKISIVVGNLTNAALANVPVFFQVDGGAKVIEYITSLAANKKTEYTFTATADLSTVNATYTITSGIDQVDDNIENNVINKTVYNKNELPLHTNTNGYAISKLKWDDFENASGTTAYSDFTNKKIPVYAGEFYNPEVTLVRPGNPITTGLTSTSGLFTMIIIDLNGDGNLTDEFYAGAFWVNSLANASTTSVHKFRNNLILTSGGLRIPTNTASGEKLMRIIHMFRSPNELYNVVLGPTFDGLTSSRSDFEVEEYTINVLPTAAKDAGIDEITTSTKPRLQPVTVSAVVKNYSLSSSISNFEIAYKINGGAEIVETFTEAIAAGSRSTFNFTTKADLSVQADYTIEVYTKLIDDANVTNDAKTIMLSHVAPHPTNVNGAFIGKNDSVISDTTPAINLTNNYSFEAWINQKAENSFGVVFDKSKIMLRVVNNSFSSYKQNSLALFINNSYFINTGSNTIEKDKWYHIAFTVSSANEYTIYIDGIIAPYTVVYGAAGAAEENTTSPICIGSVSGLANAFIGNIDEVRIWSGVRNQATILANSMTKYTGKEAGLLAYYPFEEGDKQFVFDKSTNDNTATVFNADTDGIGKGKFWNSPVLLKDITFANQSSSSYDESTKKYTIILNDGADVTAAVAHYNVQMNSHAKINGITQVSGVTQNNYTNPIVLTVEGVGFNSGITENYTIEILTGVSNESKLISYQFDTSDNSQLSQNIATTITGNNAVATVSYGINVSGLIANFNVSNNAELYINNVIQLNKKTIVLDYNNSVLVKVVSGNKLSETNYVITLNAKNSETDFINYSVSNQIGASVINTVTNEVSLLVNNNATLSTLKPVFQVSNEAKARIGTYVQNSGITMLNYDRPVTYNILAQNGNIKNWKITIERAKPTITLVGNATIVVPIGCTYIEAGYAALDNLNNDITANVITSGTIDLNTVGQYALTYTVNDALNNQSSVTRTINVTNDTCTLSLNENSLSGFSIFPIPARDGKIFIISNENGAKNIKIFDTLGKEVLSKQLSETELNISTLANGIYYLRLEQNGKTAIRKIIKR